ncbi:hypothetical protein Q1695_003828 [Nippostrongylus brasiliensis]|nr:hypothetical protein Q1695_003828 [Nippostrongylus brasiliensis]
MLKAFLGKYDTSTSTFVVPGLPPLEINAGRNGYFDGYIMSATGMDHMWLTPSYDNIAAIAAAAVVVPPRAGFSIQRGSLAIVRLQYKGNVKRWTRVIVENRQDAAHVQVYLIDYGARQTLSARSLYEMPLEMKRFPPQAFPILPQITSPPDYGPGEWARLEKVRVTARFNSVKDEKFVCDQLTVYDAVSRNYLELGAALRSGVDLERANSTTTSTVPPISYQNYLIGGGSSNFEPVVGTAINSRFRQEQRDLSVLVISVFGVVIAVGAIVSVVGFTYRRIQAERERHQRRLRANRERLGPPNQGPPNQGGGNNSSEPWQPSEQQDTSREVVTAAPLTESGSQERRRIEADTQTACKPPLPDELKQQHSIVPLQPTAIAIIAALMGSSSAILDKRLSRTIAIETGKENSIVDGSFDTRPRFGAGTSDISSIKGSSPRPGGVMITPVTSSERSNVSRSQSYQPSSDHVSKSQSSQRPEGEMITPVTTSERSSVSRSQSYLPSSDQSATSPSSGSSENSSSERSSDQGALGVAERSNSNPPTSVDNEYFESVTPDDVQRILMERAIIRQQ